MMRLRDGVPIEWQWQQLAQLGHRDDRGQVREHDLDIAAVFPEQLPACATRRCRGGGVGDDNETRSAHIVNPYDAFSMLQPVKMRPSTVCSAAPTRKFE